MTIQKTLKGDKLTLALDGRIDTITSPQMQTELMNAFEQASDIEIEFLNVQYISSAGLRVLLMGQKYANQENKKMKLINVSPEVMEVFEMTGFSSILTIE